MRMGEGANMRIERLRVNHIVNPLGFDLGDPRFSWDVINAKGTRAQAAQIVVSAGGQQVADTGWGQFDSAAARIEGLSDLLHPRTRYEWTVSVRTNAGEEAVSEPSWFETGKMDESWDAEWICCEGSEPRHPIFWSKIPLREDSSIESARLYVCGLGIYDAYLDDIHVGEEYLAPGTHAYDRWLQVATHDVTKLLHAGSCLELHMGNGWWRGRFGFIPVEKGFYGDDWRLIAELRVRYADGSEQVFGTDGSWQVSRSNVLASSIYDGQQIDDTLPELPTLAATLLDAAEAKAATAKLRDRLSLPIAAHETFAPELIHTPADEVVYDVGQNIAGTFRLRVHEPAGTTVRVQCGELLQDGNFYRDNLRSAKAELVYVSDGREHMLEPRFTYYGYRYAKVEGIADPKPEDFEGVALYSAFEEIGHLTTGHALVNQLISNVTWGMKSNFVDTPTDCPQRDERLGWTGDAQVFSATALYLADQYAFYRKYLHDMALEQDKLDGAVSMVVPAFMLCQPANAAWGDATCIIPWNMYLMSGDDSILLEHFDAMRAWVDYVARVDGDDHGWRRDVFQFGDWLALDGPAGERLGGTDEGYIADLYFWRSARIVADAAHVLGRAEDESRYHMLAERIAAWIRSEYFSATGRCVINTQTSYTLALVNGFGNAEFSAVALDRLLARNGGKLSTGFVGTGFLARALVEAGRVREAYELLLNEDYPGWLHCVRLGATTIWERWNSLDEMGHITGIDMNSLNHYAYGAIVEWLFAYAAGLRFCVHEPGFRRATVAPLTNWRLHMLDYVYRATTGRWRVVWECLDESHLHFLLTVPFGCTADVALPSAPKSAYETLGGHTLSAGTYELTYETVEPLRRMPSIDWTLASLMASPDTEAVLKRHCYHPEFAVKDPSLAERTIRELAPGFARGGGPMGDEGLAACDKDLHALWE